MSNFSLFPWITNATNQLENLLLIFYISMYIAYISNYISRFYFALSAKMRERNCYYSFQSISRAIFEMQRTFSRITQVKRKSISCFANFVKSFRMCVRMRAYRICFLKIMAWRKLKRTYFAGCFTNLFAVIKLCMWLNCRVFHAWQAERLIIPDFHIS